jgi:hypothetical protein
VRGALAGGVVGEGLGLALAEVLKPSDKRPKDHALLLTVVIVFIDLDR